MGYVLEKAYENSYLPFLEIFEGFESLKLNLHISGYLLEWLVNEKPSYIERIKELVRAKRVEMLTGGMYEPVLSMIPKEDGVGQIKMHRKFIKDIFGINPEGMWVAERVYEPHLPEVISLAQVSYIILDDHHFKAVGLDEDDLYGYYLTEFENYTIKVFPGIEYLRYALPFRQVREIDGYFRSVHSKGGNLLVFADDGEKFGLWPGTFDYVYREGWLKAFFSYLEENGDWLKTVLFGDYVAQRKPLGLIYLNCNSYREMDEWCLPARKIKDYEYAYRNFGSELRNFLEGGYYRYFLIKYEESNDMHKKMLQVSKAVRNKRAAKRSLYKAQCNDAYWHGVFGGLYLPHLRSEVYRNLIDAEKAIEGKGAILEGYFQDINLDGYKEAILNTKSIKAYFLLKEGGVLYELDYKPRSVNLIATLRRRYEAYHEKIKKALPAQLVDGTKTIHDLILTKEVGLEDFLHFDWYRRASLVDHVLGDDVSFESFFKCEYREPGDFVKEPYEGKIERKKGEISLRLVRNGNFWKDCTSTPLSVEKTVTLRSAEDTVNVEYTVSGETEERFFFGVEFNFSFLNSGGERFMEVKGERFPLTKTGVIEGSNFIRFFDPYQKVEVILRMDDPYEIWTHPVEVVSLSEGGFERNYQSTMVMPLWIVDLKEGKKNFQIQIQINGLGDNNNVQ